MTMLGRVLPAIDAENAYFWRSGGEGELRILRCGSCRFWLHPPSPICRRCRSRQVAPEVVSGRGVVFAHTVNFHRWQPDMEVPFTVATVELTEQQRLRVTTQIVGCAPEDVYAGMPVEVQFLRVEDVWLPLFSPTSDRSRG
jgi:uncharacterized OB-fold protein